MTYMKLLPLLLLLIYPQYIRGEDSNGKGSHMGNLFTSMQNIQFMGSSLVSNLTEVFNTLAKINAGQRRDNANEELKSMVTTLTEFVRDQGERLEEQQENIANLRKSLDMRLRENELKLEWALTDGTLAPKNTSGIMEMLKEIYKNTHKPGTCAEIDGGDASGVHRIYPVHTYPKLVNCDTSAGGGWTVIQRRFDGNVDFYRGWEEYAEGFGNPAGEYWLGLRHVHALTQAQPMELYIGLTDFDQGPKYAKYSSFSVSSEMDKFRLHIGTYSGNAGNSLRGHNGARFSTKDQDNDSWASHCSTTYHGAWWYTSCHSSNLNGLYSKKKVDSPKYMTWYRLHNAHRALKTSVMMIRPANFKP